MPLLSLMRRPSAGRMMILAMNKRTSTRAAGVSPPWFGRHLYANTRAIARKTADSMWADHRCHRAQRYHGGLTPPALGCTTFVRCEKRHSQCANACLQERRASAPVAFRTASASAVRRTSAFGSRVLSALHGGLTPPLLVARCRFAGENDCHGAQRISLRKTTFAVRKRTFTRAARVSPPWELLTPVR
jgi:hypothetical protein